ncbi:uncharacterized protein LOC116852725 [Odontomachus brunneus]|uniref:uncharacterized protein LOC116852725 n=1 Tax=Odontomachus brunneus TaxID=486640 RepID=UPI0013F1C1A5|nr:uncharacterized protein LOC116852725 [Odontomachus brunneus]
MTDKNISYMIVQINYNKESNKSIDSASHIVAVPSSWIYFSKSLQALATKYIFPPYDNSEDELLLEELLLSKVDPPELWSEYAVLVRGQAKTYTSALQHISNLQTAIYSFTEDESINKNETYNNCSSVNDCYINISKIPSLKSTIDNSDINAIIYKTKGKENMSESLKKPIKKTSKYMLRRKEQSSSSSSTESDSSENVRESNAHFPWKRIKPQPNLSSARQLENNSAFHNINSRPPSASTSNNENKENRNVSSF